MGAGRAAASFPHLLPPLTLRVGNRSSRHRMREHCRQPNVSHRTSLSPRFDMGPGAAQKVTCTRTWEANPAKSEGISRAVDVYVTLNIEELLVFSLVVRTCLWTWCAGQFYCLVMRYGFEVRADQRVPALSGGAATPGFKTAPKQYIPQTFRSH